MVKASFMVTVYQLSLGSYSATTGIPARQYTSVQARVFVGPKGTSRSVLGSGFYGQYNAEGITGYELNEGDIVKVTYSSMIGGAGFWQVMGKFPVTWGNKFSHYQLDLAKLLSLPFIEPTSGGGGGGSTLGGYDPNFYDDRYYAHYIIVT